MSYVVAIATGRIWSDFVHKKGSENFIVVTLTQVPTKDEDMMAGMPETQCLKVDDL